MTRRLKLLLGALALALLGSTAYFLTRPKPGPGQAQYRAARQAADRGDFNQQAEALRSALLVEPGNADYHSDLADAWLQLAQYDAARAELQATAFLDPRRPHVYCRLAQALVELRRRGEALEALETALRLTPNCPHALAVQGEQYLRDDNLKDALPAFEKVMRMQPDFVLAYQNAGFLLLSANRVDEAISVLEKGVKLAPSHSGLHALLGEAYGRRPGDPRSTLLSEQHFRLSLTNNPEAAKAHASLGNLLLRKNDLPGAFSEFEQAVALQPVLPEAQYGLSQIATRQGKSAEAARQLKLYQQSQGLVRQLSELQSQATARPDDLARQLQLARFAVEHHLLAPAGRALENAVQIDPGLREVRELRARYFLAQGQGERASGELAVAAHLPNSHLP